MSAVSRTPFHYRIMSPIRYFFNDSRAVGVLLIICTIVSLGLSNLSSGTTYQHFWNRELMGGFSRLPGTPLHWINDFLMSFFFLLAGMEIKRELIAGELASFKKAILPFGAALGGMLVPAIIFVLFNMHSGFEKGWGIPTATDIAFSLGVASLLGKRVPVGLKILLMAIAIIDDLGAILVIALFYGNQIHWAFLGLAAVAYGALWICNIRKMKLGPLQIVLAVIIWFAMFNSGVEAGIAGVLVAFALPVSMAPLIEKYIHKPVNFIILPLFALANTAITIPSNFAEAVSSPVSQGVLFGLVFGKPIGIYIVSRLMVGLGVASLPAHTRWSGVLGMGTLAGIGFTMSIFTTSLAFGAESLQNLAKIAILIAMVGSLVISWIYFTAVSQKTVAKRTDETIPVLGAGSQVALS